MIHTIDGWMVLLVSVMSLIMGWVAWQIIIRLPEQMLHEWHNDALDLLTQHDDLDAQHRSKLNHQMPKVAKPAFGVGMISVMAVYALLGIWANIVYGWTLIYGLALAFAWFGVVLSGIDLRVQLLPDRLVLPLGMLGLFINGFEIITSASDAIFGAVTGFLVLWSISTLHRLMRGYDGMGLGDAKLLAACGAWLGVHQLPLVVLIAAGLGVMVGIIHKIHLGNSKPFAFGPYLIIGAWLSLLYSEQIMQSYLALFGL